MLHKYDLFNGLLGEIASFKTPINTLNTHLFNAVRKDTDFRRTTLNGSNVLLPGGTNVVWATKMFAGQKMKIVGDGLFSKYISPKYLEN